VRSSGWSRVYLIVSGEIGVGLLDENLFFTESWYCCLLELFCIAASFDTEYQ
jgi:hypothetical protein